MYKENIKSLVTMCQATQDMFHINTTSGFTCNCLYLFYHNRVFVENNFDYEELALAKKYHPNSPYCLLINSQNIDAKNSLPPDVFEFCISWPAMKLDLKAISESRLFQNQHILIKEISSEKEIVATWIPLVIYEYNSQIILTEDDFQKAFHDWEIFFTYLKSSIVYKNMHFFLGYWDGTPVATGLFITQNNDVYIHWIGCMPDFRKRGIGSAITSIPLDNFKKQGIKRAFLFASVMGKPIYEKLGFSVIGSIDVYKTK
jgi:GNAT superfamily N-acetyltransferase